MNARLGTMILAASASVMFLLPAAAQEPAPLRQAVRFHVKPDRVAEFVQLQTQLTELAKEGGVGYRGIWRNQSDLGEFVILTPRDNFASFDGQGGGPPEVAAIVARMQQTYTSRTVEVSRVLHELGVQGDHVPKIVLTQTITVHPGKGREYITYLADRAAVAKKLGLKNFGTTRGFIGSSPATFTSWHELGKYAELDSPNPVNQAMDADTRNKWSGRLGDLVKEPAQIRIYTYQEDMSYYPQR